MTEANETADQKQAEDADITEPKAKKPKLFSGKEFRKQLRGEERMRGMQEPQKVLNNFFVYYVYVNYRLYFIKLLNKM